MEENRYCTAQEKTRKAPKNIRQIGITETGKAVYIEDYVITFLNKVSKIDKPAMQAVILLGNFERSNNYQTYVEGAVCVTQKVVQADGSIVFSKDMWNDVLEQMAQYFSNLEVVGWYLASPGWNKGMEEQTTAIHKEHFYEKNAIFFFMDTIEKEEKILYIEDGELKVHGGYYIYYEKNTPMQEYMVQYFGENTKEPVTRETDKATQQFRRMVHEKEKKPKRIKKGSGFSYTFSVFGLLAVFAVGMSVLDNYEKITAIEQTVKHLTNEVSGMAVASTTDGTAAMKEQSGITYEHVEDTAIENPERVSIENLGTPGKSIQEEQDKKIETPLEPEVEENETDMQEDKEEAQETSDIKEQQVYIVEPGDTLETISQKMYHTSQKVDEIRSLNQIEDVDKIIAGQKIWLP